MIVRDYLHTKGVIQYTYKNNLYFLAVASTAVVAYWVYDVKWIGIPFMPLGVMGTALAIFLAFRNNASYDRWWEARKLWGNILNDSRNLIRQLRNLSDQEKVRSQGYQGFHRDFIYRHLAYVNAMRIHLRESNRWDDLRPYLEEADFNKMMEARHRPNFIARLQSDALRKAYTDGIFGTYEKIEIDRTMSNLTNWQGGVERLKGTPLPRMFDYFTRIFNRVFVTLLPFSFVKEMGFMTIPLSMIVSFVFAILEVTGTVLPQPFQNTIGDTPLNAICRTIEIDAKTSLGERDIPDPEPLVDGVLW